jgi:hypothetical protein
MSEEQPQELLDETLNEIMEDALDSAIESLKEIEQQVFEQHGDPDTSGEVWALVSTADRDGTDSFEEDKLVALLAGKGPDLYMGLENRELAVIHSLIKGRVGVMVRSGAWMGPGGDVKPSDHPDKKSCIITASFVSNHVFFIVRYEDGTVQASSMNETEYNEGRAGGQQRLVDAILDFDYLPTALREHEYDAYMDIVEAFQKNLNEEQTE